MPLGSRRPRAKSTASRGAILFTRSLLAFVLAALAVVLWMVGTEAIRTRSYDFSWNSSSSLGTGFLFWQTAATSGIEQLRGTPAVEHGVGLAAAGGMLAIWSACLVWSIAGRVALGPEWSRKHTLLTLVSLVATTICVMGFFPPWRIGQRPSCNAFYLVLFVCALLGTVRDEKRLRQMGQFLFPAMILTGILVGQFWPGFFAGVLIGIFAGFVLATHLLLLIPRARAKLWQVDPALDAQP